MNKSIIAIMETKNNTAKKYAEILSLNRNHRINITFTKKDGSLREMTIVPQTEWNDMLGKNTTAQGRKMINTKVKNGMATVVEILADGVFQPRTINLTTIVDYKVLPR